MRNYRISLFNKGIDVSRRCNVVVAGHGCAARLMFFLAMLFGVIVLQSAANAAAPEHKRILILHSFGRDFRPWSEYARTIRAELARQSPWPLDFSDHSLVSARSGDDSPEGLFVDYLNSLEAKRAPDLIVCIGAPAASFVQRHRSKLFPDTPKLITAVARRRVQSDKLTQNDAAVSVVHNFPAIIDNILQVAPATKTVMVVIGASPNEKFWSAEVQKELKPLEGRIKLMWTDDIPFKVILEKAATLPPDTAILWGLMNVDAAGVAHEGDTALKQLFAVANAPVFSYDAGYFGGGIVGGPMFSVEDISQKTAAVAVRILAGEQAGDINVPPIPYAAPKYDWRLLRRWGINENLLPPGSQIDFREASAFERYRWQVFAVCAAVLMQALLISGLLFQRKRAYTAELEARKRMSELAHINRFTTAGELTATIAHELNQPLGAILTNAETLEEILKSPTPDLHEIKDIAADIRRDDQRASDVVRRLRSLLSRTPFELKEIDLNDVAHETVDLVTGLAFARQVDISCFTSPPPLLIKGDRVQLQQVLLNLIVNAIEEMSNKPAAERRIKVGTARRDKVAEIIVSDNGSGIPADKLDQIFRPFSSTKPSGMGIGLSIARTIVEAHHGRIRAENREGGGATFYVSLPLS
jgi:signal transduction histidine kinase